MLHVSPSQVFVILILTSLQATFAVGSDTGKANAISSGLRYLAESGEAWKEKRGCVSCHQIPPMLWAMNLAHKYALPNAVPSTSKDFPAGVNSTDERTSDASTTDDEPPTVTPTMMSIEDWNAWSVDVVNFVKPPQKATCNIEETMTGNIDTMAGLLLASPSTAAGDWKQRNVACGRADLECVLRVVGGRARRSGLVGRICEIHDLHADGHIFCGSKRDLEVRL